MTTRVKICGITRVEDARAAARAGASAIGLVFWPGSPRCVTAARAAEIGAAASHEGLSVVGVFVDQPPALLQEISRTARLDAIQLHGHETVGAYEFGVRVIKAFVVRPDWDVAELEPLPPSMLPLLDAVHGGRTGGTGRKIDWRLGAAASAIRPIALAGGLHAENVATAIEMVSPYAVDVSSGVEARPGIKDAAKMHAFVAAVAAASGAVPRGLFS